MGPVLAACRSRGECWHGKLLMQGLNHQHIKGFWGIISCYDMRGVYFATLPLFVNWGPEGDASGVYLLLSCCKRANRTPRNVHVRNKTDERIGQKVSY